MDDAHETESDDDLDERLARVFEERGLPNPPPRPPAAQTRPPGAQTLPPCAQTLPPGAPARGAPAPTGRIPPAPSPGPHMSPSGQTPPRRGSRREKTILLGMLGTLAGAFVGVLSMKLLVPRPPAGAGPDIHLATPGGEPLAIVDPPVLTALPPTAAIPPDPFRSLGVPPATPDEDQAALGDGPPTGGGAADPALADASDTGPLPSPGRFAPRHGADRFAAADAPDLAPPAPPPASRFAPPGSVDEAGFARQERFGAPPDRFDSARTGVIPAAATSPLETIPAGAAAPIAGGDYVVRPGDTWWSVAESTYGDGRFYKALFAWNRTLDPRVTLAPGTRLDLPREEQLRAAWGRLAP